jgi:Na+/melibiose symporter-like transporter
MQFWTCHQTGLPGVSDLPPSLIAARRRSILCLILVEIAALSLWFVSAAVLPEMTAETGLGKFQAAALSTAVQLGFVLGVVLLALHGTADHYDPRRVFAVAGALAAISNLGLVYLDPGSPAQIAMCGVTGLCLAGVCPVGWPTGSARRALPDCAWRQAPQRPLAPRSSLRGRRL